MLDLEEELRRHEIEDILCDRDDYDALTVEDRERFHQWTKDHWLDFYDAHTEDGEWVADFQINAMFDHWMTAPTR